MKTEKYATVYGSPGTRVRLAGLLRTQWPLLIGVALTGYLIRAALPQPPISIAIVGLLFLALAIGIAAAANHSRQRLQAFLKGAKGEEITARELSLLPHTFTVFHGIAIAKPLKQQGANYDFDHIVVGANGIFLIETKNWADEITIKDGELLYGGQHPTRPPLDQVKSGAKNLSEFLFKQTGKKLEVRPILCFASNNVPQGQQGAMGVLICNATRLNETITDCNDAPLTDATRKETISILRKNSEI